MASALPASLLPASRWPRRLGTARLAFSLVQVGVAHSRRRGARRGRPASLRLRLRPPSLSSASLRVLSLSGLARRHTSVLEWREARAARPHLSCARRFQFNAIHVEDRFMGQLDGKTALIFGVANHNSVAWAIAEKLAAQGARLAFTYQERMEHNVRKLTANMEGALVLPCDVQKDDEL